MAQAVKWGIIVWLLVGSRDLYLLKETRVGLGPTQPRNQWVQVLLSHFLIGGRGVNFSKCEAYEWVERYLLSPVGLHGPHWSNITVTSPVLTNLWCSYVAVMEVNLQYFFLCRVSLWIAAVFYMIGIRELTVPCLLLQRPPSSSLSYPGPGNDDVRSPGSGGTPGPLSQQPSSQQSVDNSDPGKTTTIHWTNIHGQGFVQVADTDIFGFYQRASRIDVLDEHYFDVAVFYSLCFKVNIFYC